MTSSSTTAISEDLISLLELEDVAVLAQDVRSFKDALDTLRGTLNLERGDMSESRRVAHERFGVVLGILRIVLEKYPKLQSTEILLSASTLIQHLKYYGSGNSNPDDEHFIELIDQLALAISSRVSEYLMGDLNDNTFLEDAESDTAKSCTNLPQDYSERENDMSWKEDGNNEKKKEDIIEQLDEAFLQLKRGIELALHQAKIWSKYAKDILMNIERTCYLEMEYSMNLNTTKQTAHTMVNQEPLSVRRSEHEKERRQLKEKWCQEVTRMHDNILSMRQARKCYIKCLHEADQHVLDEAASQKVADAKLTYKMSISEANEGHKHLLAVKNEILQKVRILFKESDLVLKSATLAYFQLQPSQSISTSVECGLQSQKKCSETLRNPQDHKNVQRKMTVFGMNLSQHLSETNSLIPHIVYKCIHEVDARGKLTKGIYRVSGVKSKVEKLCQEFENEAEFVNLTDIHPNVIANVLKLYLRQLPEPLISFNLYPEFIRIARIYPSISQIELEIVKEQIKELMKKLPCQHYLTLALLILHLKRISNYAEVNNMPPRNLGIVFGPTLLRTEEESASLISLDDTIHQTHVIEILIMCAEDLFPYEHIAEARDCSLAMLNSMHKSDIVCNSFPLRDSDDKLKENESIIET